MSVPEAPSGRLDWLDAVRASALLLGVVFHAALSFVPFTIGWAVMDVSTDPLVALFITLSHAFRMELFFLLAGFFTALVLSRRDTGTFVSSRLIRLGVPFIVGWFLCRPLLVAGWVMGHASMTGTVDLGAGMRAGFASIGDPQSFLVGTHLWFLYYLMMISALYLVLRGLVNLVPAGARRWGMSWTRRLGWLGRYDTWLALVLPLTTLLLLGMRSWGMDTPDKSLVPHLPVLGIYGGFFLVGTWLHRVPGWLAHAARLTWNRGALALTGVIVIMVLAGVQGDPGHPRYELYRIIYSAAYATFMWSAVLLSLGAGRLLIRRTHGWIRYLADASYWVYLVHLPIVVFLQIAVAEQPWHWAPKLTLIVGVTMAVSLLSYDLLVRPTFIGRLLHGRTYPRALQWSSDPAATRPATAVSPSPASR